MMMQPKHLKDASMTQFSAIPVAQLLATVKWKKTDSGWGIASPDEDIDDEYDDNDGRQYELPTSIRYDYDTLDSYMTEKREREYWKLCAFYNKLFPSLESMYSDIVSGSPYNALPFTITENEEPDQLNGFNTNYLKACIDKIVSRLRGITFEVRLQTSTPILLFEMYRTQIERYFKTQIRVNRLEHLTTECFHDSMILGYSHIFHDPFTKEIRKVNDWEVGYYQSEFNNHALKMLHICHKVFPVSSLKEYVRDIDEEQLEGIINNQHSIQLDLFMDCYHKKCYALVDNYLTCTKEYPFDKVLFNSFTWDMGVLGTHTCSLFDLLFPLQRQINKLSSKLSNLYMNFTGMIPVISVFGEGSAPMLEQLDNSGCKVMLINSAQDATKMIGSIEPIPLNPTIAGEIDGLKARMLELSGTQEISLNLDNLRSAAAVVALDQMRDANFESQLFKMAEFMENCLIDMVRFNAGYDKVAEDNTAEIPWSQFIELVDTSFVELVPVHGNDAENKPLEPPEDFQLFAVDKFIVDCIKGKVRWADADYSINYDLLKKNAVNKLLRFRALGGDFQNLEELCVDLFIEDVKQGLVQLGASATPAPKQAEQDAPAGGGAEEAPAPQQGSEQQAA